MTEEELLTIAVNETCTSIDIDMWKAFHPDGCWISHFRHRITAGALRTNANYEAYQWMKNKNIINLDNDNDFLLFKLKFG